MLCGIKMEFEEIYFEGEIREGFYIQPLMKRAWAAQLEILHEIDVICKKHKIKYFAEWGTLLGAVRHKGFIPWDDDIDIGMLREDYEKFLHYAKKELTGSSYVLDINNAYFDELMARVMNTDKITFDSEFLDKYHGCPYGIGVDIFCLDHIPKNKEEEQILLTLLAATDSLGRQWDSDEISEEEKWDNVRLIEELTGVHFNNDVPVKKQLIQLADKISAMYWDAESDEVSLLFLTTSKPDYRLPLSCYEETIEVPFENTVIPIPVGYDEVLKLRYGKDYMTPVKVWHTHDYPFFKAQIQMLREFYQANGLEMPECYDMECR